MTKNKESEVIIGSSEYVTVTQMGHIVEVQHMQRKNTESHIKKIDSDRYVLLETGEIREFNKSENRGENTDSLRKTFKRLRYLINANFNGSPNELHVTLTYAENMKDTEQLKKDFEKFIKRLRYKMKMNTVDLDYISVVEPQGRGAWHMHVLMRFNSLDKVFIPNADMRELWGHGFVTIKSLKDVDNIGAYLSAYLADVELTGENFLEALDKEIKVREVNGESKKFVKGGRLHMYPPGMNLYRSSKGIRFPERLDMPYKEAKKIVGSLQPHYRQSYNIERDNFKNTITYEQYNLKRR